MFILAEKGAESRRSLRAERKAAMRKERALQSLARVPTADLRAMRGEFGQRAQSDRYICASNAKSLIWQRPNRPHGAGASRPPLGSDAVSQSKGSKVRVADYQRVSLNGSFGIGLAVSLSHLIARQSGATARVLC
jgi:hypothetical protein